VAKRLRDVVLEVGAIILIGLWIWVLFAVPIALLHFIIKFW